MDHRVHILGIPLDPLTFDEALSTLKSYAVSDHFHHVMTPNPEMLVTSTKNPTFRNILQKSALNLPDGSGLLLIAKLLKETIPERVTGTDMVQALCREPAIGPVFFLGSAPGVAKKASMILKEKNPHLIVAGYHSGSPADSDAKDIIDRINASEARVLFVAFGAPTQDLWIDQYRDRMPNIRLAMGIGGAFDFIAGERSRAPLWMQKIGIEWLWRLLQEPSRLRRILVAVIVFPLLVLCKKEKASM